MILIHLSLDISMRGYRRRTATPGTHGTYGTDTETIRGGKTSDVPFSELFAPIISIIRDF